MNKLMMAVGAVMMGAVAMASTPASFAYQGVLRDDAGKPLTENRVKITFSLYNDPTAEKPALWSQTQTVSLDTNGLFNVELSDSTNGLAAVIAECEADGNSLYIGLNVDGSAGEIRPRQKLIAAPLAAYAQDVREAKGDLTVNGTAYFKGPVSMMADTDTLTAGKIDAKGTLEASGKATFKVGADVGGDLLVTGNETVNGKISGSSLAIGGAASVGGDITLPAGKTVKANGVEIGVPVGCILMWSGSESDIPAGWALCDGKTVNNKTTPDLRGRFIVGANRNVSGFATANSNLSIYSPTTTGGEEKHTLTADELPSHQHGLSDGNSWRTVGIDDNTDYYVYTPKAAAGKTSTILGKTNVDVGMNTASAGKGLSHENRPPYYALCFIMKVK